MTTPDPTSLAGRLTAMRAEPGYQRTPTVIEPRKPDPARVSMAAAASQHLGAAAGVSVEEGVEAENSPQTTSLVLLAVLAAASEATEVGEDGYSQATADEVMARQIPELRHIDLKDPLGLNPTPEPEVDRPGEPECKCGVGDCCGDADKGMDDMVQRVRGDVPMLQAEQTAAETAAVDALAKAIAAPPLPDRTPDAPRVGTHRPRVSQWGRFLRAVKPLRSKRARGLRGAA